jgi:hypothetical protein
LFALGYKILVIGLSCVIPLGVFIDQIWWLMVGSILQNVEGDVIRHHKQIETINYEKRFEVLVYDPSKS